MWQPEPPDFVRIAGAIYDARPSESEWFRRTVDAVTGSMPSVIASIIAVARSDDGRLSHGRGWAADPSILEFALDVAPRQHESYMRRRSQHLAITDRQLMGSDFSGLRHAEWLRRLGGEDIFGLGGPDSDGVVVAISVAVPSAAEAWPEALVDAWEAVALHLGAAARFREAVLVGHAIADAIFTPEGKLLDAFGDAVAERVRLRDVVQRVQRSRGRYRDKPEPLAARTPSIDGRWTLVDQFDADGRHFIVAYVVDEQKAADPLSQQERRVAELVAAGWSMKRIAYRLGLTPGTIASYAARACRKLGVRGRIGLARELSRS